MDERLKLSKYLRFIPRDDGIAIYHSLTGGLCIVDKNIYRLLKMYRRPHTINELSNLLSWSGEKQIKFFTDLFKSKGFLIKPGYDEYNVIREKIELARAGLQSGSQIGVIQLVVTNNCNFNCDYCFINDIYSSEKRILSQRSYLNRNMTFKMAISAIEEVIRLIKKNGRNILGIQFFGGEPLLNWKTIKSVLNYFGRGESYNIQINYSIVTNGFFINQEKANSFKKYNVPVIVSLDSSELTNRFPVRIKYASSRIRQNLEILKKNGNIVIFNTVFSNETFDFFDTTLVDFALTYNIHEIGVLLDLESTFYEKRKASEIVDRLMQLYRYGKTRNVVVTGYWQMIFQRLVIQDHFKYNTFKTCSATGCQLSVEPLGEVFACKASSGFFGDIAKMDELLSSDTYVEYALRTFQNASECAGCEIEGFCSGFCLGPLEKKYNTIHVVEKSTCKIYIEITKKLIQDIGREWIENYSLPWKYA